MSETELSYLTRSLLCHFVKLVPRLCSCEILPGMFTVCLTELSYDSTFDNNGCEINHVFISQGGIQGLEQNTFTLVTVTMRVNVMCIGIVK